MTRVRLFQSLVVASLLAYGAFFLLPLAPVNHSSDVQALLEYAGYGGAISPSHPLIFIPIALLKIVASIGLILFLAWGRWLLLAHIAISLALIPFIGMAIYTPMDSMIGFISAMLDGALLMLCFTPPYCNYLRRDE